jgi:hypothetical protein
MSGVSGAFQSAGSGNWNSLSTWQYWDGSGWVAATWIPSATDKTIEILANHVVTVDGSITVNEVTIDGLGQVTINPSVTLTVSDTAGTTDLIVNGTLLNRGSLSISNGATWALNDGATYIHNTTSAISGVVDAATISAGSAFEYKDATYNSVAGRTYGTLKFTTAGSRTYSSSGGSASPLVVQGDLLIGSGVTWNTGGFAGDITVQGTTTINGTWTKGTGDGDLGAHTFWSTFTVNGTYNLATTGTGGDIYLEGDVANNGTFATPSNRSVYFNSERSLTISGASPIVFNNGFTSYCGITIAPGATIQVASGKTASVEADLTVGGTISGASSTLNFSGSNLTLNSAVVSIANLLIDDDCDHYLEGSGTFTGCTLRIELGYPQLSNDLTITGGTIEIVEGWIDIYGYVLTLNSVVLADSSTGYVEDTYSGEVVRFGKVVTKGSTTIDQGGAFWVPLEVDSATTTASGANSFDGNITVDEGATLTIPSGKFLRATASVTINSGAAVNGPGTLYYAAPDQYFTNGGTISAPAVFEGINYQYTYLDGDGTWTSLTINDSVNVDLQSNTFLTNSNITLNSLLRTLSYVLNLNGGTLQVNSKGTVTGGAYTFETQGTVSVIQQGSFSEPFEVVGGVTTAHGVFSGDITVDDGATLGIPSGDTLTAAQNVTVNRASTGGTISGPGRLLLTGYGKTFSNDGLVSAPTTFIDNDGDTKIITGSGSWASLTIPSGEGADNRGTMHLVGSPVPLTVNGTIIDTAGSFVYKGTSSQTVAPLTYRMLAINNHAGVSLSGPTSVTGTLTITNGNLTTGADTLTLGGSATITETASYSVIGNLTTARVCSTGVNQTFGGMGLEINAAGAWPGSTTVTRVTGTAPTFPPGVPVKRYFDIAPVTNSGLNATFVYYYLDSELNGNNETVLALYKSTDGGSTWTAQGGTVNTGSNMITLTGVNEFSRWVAGGTGNPVPSVSGVSPTTAALGATLDVVLTGTEFAGGISTPSFGSEITVNSFTVNSPTQITANITISLSAAIGARDVTVANSAPGGGSGTLEDAFTLINPVPTLTSIDPGAADRGTDETVVLQGSNFVSGVTTVGFGPGITVTSTTVESSTQIRVEIKIGAGVETGPRDVTITNPTPGGGSATLAGAFTIGNPAPTISGMTPAVGFRGQTLTVRLSGSSFLSGVSSVDFGSGITVNSIAIGTKTQMEVNITIALDAPAGSRDVSVTNPAPGGGTATETGAFTVENPAPTLASITPASGNRRQTLDVTVTGTNFLVGVTTCSYGSGITVNSVSSVTLTQVTANVTIDPEAATGPRDITVTNAAPGGGSATLAGAFTVTNPVPTLSGVSPSQAGRGSKLNVVLTGTNFLEGVSTVSFGPDITVNSTSISSSTQITVDISIGASAATGGRNVTVTNAAPGGGSALLTGGFTVDTSPATGVESMLGAIPNEFVLREAYPNPFNPSTNIGYGLPERSRVKLEVYNMLGNIVAVLVEGERSKGYYEVEWIAGNMPSGVYLIRLHAESLESSKRLIASRKVVLVK